jgi:tight adherence protein C
MLPPRTGTAGGVSAAKRIAALVPTRLRPPLDLAARIEAAGTPGAVGVGEVMALKAGAALACAPVAAAVGGIAPGRLGLLLTVASPAAGFLAPDLWLARRTRERLRMTRRDLPALLDLLRVAIEAGLAPPQALAAVAARSAAPLAREWDAVAQQIQLGLPLREALDGLTRRLPAPELRAFASALNRAARHGAPLSDTLAAQARDARLARRRRIEEEAAKASPKIQLVVALLLVPSVLLIVAAALAAAMLGGDGVPIP